MIEHRASRDSAAWLAVRALHQRPAMMMRTGLLLVCALPGLAAADDRVHDFVSLDRASGETAARADLSMITGEGMDGAVTRLDLHGQWTNPTGLGLYGGFAVSRFFGDSDDEAPTVFSNLELGGQKKWALGAHSVVVHAGLSLPTSNTDDGIEHLVTNAISIQRRFNDLVTIAPDVTMLRIGISPTFTDGKLFARFDLGADIVLDEPEMSSIDPIVHANAAVGVRDGQASGALELVTVGTTGNLEEDEQRFFHTLAFSLRYDLGRVAPNFSITTPLDDDGRGEVVTVGAGVATAF
jgi:hypothetical protein